MAIRLKEAEKLPRSVLEKDKHEKWADEALAKMGPGTAELVDTSKEGLCTSAKGGIAYGEETAPGGEDRGGSQAGERTDDSRYYERRGIEQGRGGESDRQPPHLVVQTNDTKIFVNRLSEFKKEHPYGTFVSVPEDDKGTFFIAPKGSGGFRLQDGNIESLFYDRNRGAEVGFTNGGSKLLVQAINNGGNRLDCFAGGF